MAEASSSPTAVLFPGQGSQEKGMGRDLAESDTGCMDLWKTAEKSSGLPLREIFWDGEEVDMARTEALQPALTAVDLSLWLRFGKALAPSALAGHSLGEYPALAAAGVLDPGRTFELVALRGRLMAEAGGPDQGMTAVLKLSLAQVEAVAAAAAEQSGTLCIVANRNTPAQYVLSGHRQALDAAAALVREAGGRAVPLAVSGAFHSPLVEEAARDLARFMERLDWRAPRIPVYMNVTGSPEPSPDNIRGLMARQMTSPVQWTATIANQFRAGVRRFVELGPKGALSRMVGPILNDVAAPEEWQAVSAGSLAAAETLFAGGSAHA